MSKETIYNGETRYKKSTLNHFATSWQRLDVRGKSSKELRDIIVELKKVNKYLYRCVTALDYKETQAKKVALELKKEAGKTLNKSISKVKSEEIKVIKDEASKSLREAKKELKLEIINLLAEIKKLRKRLFSSLISERGVRNEMRLIKSSMPLDNSVANQYFIDLANEWKDKYDEASSRARKNLMKKQAVKTVTKKVLVEVERKKTVEEYQAERFKKYLDTPVSERVLNYTDVTLKIVSFLNEEEMNNDDIALLIKASISGEFTAQSIGVRSRRLVSLQERGYLSRGNTGLNTRENYWFLTPLALSLIKKLMNYISYGKTKL